MNSNLSILVDEALTALDWSKDPKGLYEPIAYALSSGGKRLRPLLVLLGASVFGKEPREAVPAALAIEIFHNFTLLHDDVMDNAPMRRGKPTVHVQWDDNTAILSGDQMLIEAYKQIGRLPKALVPEILVAFNKMATEVCEGQQLDSDYETQEVVTEEEYIEMIRLKTSVLIGTALQLGAILAGADETAQRDLYDYGVNVGLAFQIQDDLLDVYGDPATFGKAIGGDILEGKKTFAYISACKQASTEQRVRLVGLMQQQRLPKEEKIAAVTGLYNELGVKQICEEAVASYTHEALECLNRIPLDEAKMQPLKDLALSLITRKD